MRIDLQNLYTSYPADAVGAAKTKTVDNQSLDPVADPSTQVQISGLAAQAALTPEIRQERVNQLRQAIDSGTYSVRDAQLAQAMVSDLLHQ